MVKAPQWLPVELLAINARHTGRSVEQAAAELDAMALPKDARHEAAKLRDETRAKLRAPTPAPAPARRGRRKKTTAQQPPAWLTAEAARERRARFEAESKRRGCEKFRPKDLTPNVYAVTGRIAGTRSAEAELRRFPPAFRRLVSIAAYAMQPSEERAGELVHTRALARRRARRIIQCAALLLYLADRTKRNGHALVVEGYTRGTLCLALRRNDDTEKPPSVGSLFNTQTDGERRGLWDCGAIVALERAGAISFHQPPADTQPACNVGRDRDGTPRALNQYWITERALVLPVECAEQLVPTWRPRPAPATSETAQPRGPP